MKSIKEYQESLKKNNGKTFWDRQDADQKAHPDKYLLTNQLIESGKKAAKNYLKTCQNPENAEQYQDWKTKYNSDPKNIENYLVDLMIKSVGAKRLVIKDSAYEARMKSEYQDKAGQTRQYKVATIEDGHIMQHFKNYLNAKWNADGYEGDDEAVKEYWKNYSLSNPVDSL